MSITRRATLLAVLTTWAATTHAQSFPSKPVRVVVPFPPGGPVDQTLRLLAPKMSATLGQPVVIDNKGGASGVLGADVVAKSVADGHTLLFSAAGALAIVPNLAPSMPYNPQRDLLAVSQAVKVPTVLVVGANSRYHTLSDLLNAARSGSAINYASAGSGTNTHLGMELLKREAKVAMNHIPYRGAAPALTDLIGGQVDVMLADAPVVLPQVQAGKLRALAITSAQRIPVLKDVATTAELGLAKVEIYNWYGLVAPANTPAPAVDRLYRAMADALKDPALRATFAQQGAEVVASGPDAFGPFIYAETARWGALARSVGAKLE